MSERIGDEGFVLDTPEAIADYRVLVIIKYAEARSHGRHLTRPSAAPRIARLREQYALPASVRTWEQLAEAMREYQQKVAAERLAAAKAIRKSNGAS